MIRHSLDQHTRSLADYLPNGRMFEAKNINDSNFRQLLRGLSGELFTAEGYLATLEQEYFPDLTNLFLDEWEQALGIPDDCFDGQGDNNTRRRDIIVKLSALGIQTADDFVTLAAVFGKIVTVTPLADEAFPPLPVPFTPIGLPEGRFIMVVQGVDLISGVPPYDVPFDLIVGESVLECVFNNQAPANGDVIFRNSN